MEGTIGGGIMEYGLVEKIKDARWHLQGKAELLPLVHRKMNYSILPAWPVPGNSLWPYTHPTT